MLGLALEGGGARGAYQIGAYRALTELGFHFDAVAGASIGAINAALIAEGDWKKAVSFWSTMCTEDIFDEKDKGFLEIMNHQIGLDTVSVLSENLKTAMKNGGIDTSGIRRFLENNIDPARLMASPMDFGIVTVSFPELQPLMIFRDQMAPEDVISYIQASATFPGFQMTQIGEMKYLDGGFYDACPYNLLMDRGCDRVIAVRLNGFGFIHAPRDRKKLISIFPSESLGPIMSFDPETSKHNLELGYYDTMHALRHLPGQKYYFSAGVDGFAAFCSLDDRAIRVAGAALRVSSAYPARRALFEEILPALSAELKLPHSSGYNELLLALLEHRAARLKIERLRFYSPEELRERIAEPPRSHTPRRARLLVRPEEAVDALISALPPLTPLEVPLAPFALPETTASEHE